MKYFLLNKNEIKHNIWTNPLLIKTKAYSKIKKYRNLLSKIEKLKKEIYKELKETNNTTYEDKIILFIEKDGDEITHSEYNSIKPIALYDKQEQRIRAYNKTNILKGNLIGNEIVMENQWK